MYPIRRAIAAEAGPGLQALVPEITSSEMRSLIYPGGSFGLDSTLNWIHLLCHQEDSFIHRLLHGLSDLRAYLSAAKTLPLSASDLPGAGRKVGFFQDWLVHDNPGDPWWNEVDYSAEEYFRATVSQVTAPTHLIGGWYDIFLPQTIRDYTRLHQAGRDPHLTIGPWAHTSPGLQPVAVGEAIRWCRAHLLEDRSLMRQAPVRIFVMGANQWRELPNWPPSGYQTQHWHLQAKKGLSPSLPAAGDPDRYRYDPADPTPAVGGSSLSHNSGPRDNRKLEARSDVLVYTSAPLEDDLEIIGAIQAELFVQSSLEHTDFFARLCDVSPSGKSINLTDGLIRLKSLPAGIHKIAIDLWPSAHCFLRGHRIRLQVSSGSHPRYARNPGNGEPLASAVTLVAAEQAVYHDPEHPSAVILPVKSHRV
jgi:hypothetical protein